MSLRHVLRVLPLFTLSLAYAGAAGAAVWFVAADGSGVVPTIRDALAVAAAGDSIELGAGTFVGPGNRDLGVHQAVTIRCRDGAGPPCILDCEHAGRAFSLYAPATLEGLVIRNGLSLATVENPWFHGGGLVVAADAQVTDCVIESCQGDDTAIWGQGGGAYVFASASATFTGCTFRGNSFAPLGEGDGGGAYVEAGAAAHFAGCTFEGNVAVHGGGLAAYESDVTVDGCVFAANLGVIGGGIHADTYGWPESGPGTLTVLGSRLTGNARGPVSGARGGGIHVGADVTATVTGTTIACNRGFYGGALEVLGVVTVETSILWGNCAIGVGQGEAAWVDTGGQLEVGCSIVDDTEVLGPGLITLDPDNAAVDPLFCAPEPCEAAPTAAGEYDVDAASPALALPGCGAVGSVAAACTGVAAPGATRPAGDLALRVFPSPFATVTGIRWNAPASGEVEISLLDVAGRRIRGLAAGDGGIVRWDGTDASGRPVASGVYFVRARSSTGTTVRRVVLRR